MPSRVLKSNNFLLLLVILIGFCVWFTPKPDVVSEQAWKLFAIFIATIAGIILNPLPMGAVSLMSIAVCVLSGALKLDECLAGFGSETVWLVVFAFFISLGFIKTGLGARCAYFFISKLGKTTLGLSYSLLFADLFLSPFIPSVTARGGGIIYPIAQSLCKSYQDSDSKGVSSKTAGFIMKVCYQGNVITSAIFLTAMAANPLIVKLASDIGVKISWMDWAQAAFIPCIICLMLMPVLVYALYPPTIKSSADAPAIAKERLREMGPMKSTEIIMLITFFLLITLWIVGGNEDLGQKFKEFLGFSVSYTPAMTALIGLTILFVSKAISFEDALADKGAWHTFLWFATLVMLSGYLSKFGLMGVFGNYIKSVLPAADPKLAAVILCLVYFYIHYMFASATAHITVLFPTFLLVLVGYGFAPAASAMTLGLLSILSSGITHFGLASAPIFFGSNYMKTKTWWYIGFVCSLLYLLVLATSASIWWKIIGLI